MSQEFNLVSELALIMIAAGVFTVLSRVLKQPLILGYIIAGFIIGPHLGLFPNIIGSDETVGTWSEIGIIFLLFGLGLEFSFKKLVKIGGSALIMAGTKFIGMFTIGAIVGSAMSWSTMESIFLGGMLAMSSTTIVLKAYDDLGLKKCAHAPLVFGSLVFEDLIAVLLMVLLSTLAVSNSFDGGEMLFGLAKMAFFIILWFLVGIFIIPTLLKKTYRYLNDEILLIIALGLCFGMVSLAQLAGFSSALGAFVMGSLLSETLQGEHIAKLTGSIKDMFGAIFFVSVGMMVDPKVIASHWSVILLLSITVIVGVLFFSTSGAILAGQGLDKAVHCGFSLAMLGEFAFIIASLGCSMGVLRSFIYPVIVATSVITTFTIPFLIKSGDKACVLIRRILPQSFTARIDTPTLQENASSADEQNEWRKLIKAYLLRVILYGVVLFAIFLGSELWLSDFLYRIVPSTWSDKIIAGIGTAITLAVMLPLLSGMAVGGKNIAQSNSILLREKSANFWPVFALAILRVLLATTFIILVLISHFNLSYWSILVLAIAGILLFTMGRNTIGRFTRIEKRFLDNLNTRENYQRKIKPVAASVNDKMSAYAIGTRDYIVPADSTLAGHTLRNLDLRRSTGANIVKITRGGRAIVIPSADEIIMPGDDLLVVGTDSQQTEFERLVQSSTWAEQLDNPEFELERIDLTPASYLTGKALGQIDMRSYGCMVISIISNDEIIANPTPDYVFKEGDSVWICGEKSACSWWL
ncbi:MAG: cation:proton antiporter [Bacteroidaceae bacterium]|nr:cation:proton antiporter [Bacteroidaceae bacterium]